MHSFNALCDNSFKKQPFTINSIAINEQLSGEGFNH
jgi:hypothetical protein